jgi:predicted dehydrogenase
VPTLRTKVYTRDEDRSWWQAFEVGTVDAVREDPLAKQMSHFCQVIRGQATPLVTAQDGLNNLIVTQAIADAAARGSLVDLR